MDFYRIFLNRAIVYIHGKLNCLLINSVNLVFFFSRNAKKTHTDQIILKVSFALSEKKHLTNLQKWQLQKNFPSVYLIGTAYFHARFLFHAITGRQYCL